MSAELEERLYRQLQGAEEKPVVEASPPEQEPTPTAEDDDQPAPFAPHNFLVHHDTHPLVLDAMLLDAFQTDWLGWEPETVAEELKRVFRAPGISSLNWQQIQAVKTCHLVPSAWKEWEVFGLVCQALNNNIPNFHTMQKPTIAQVMVALDIMERIDNRQLMSEEVEKFIAAAFLDEGVYFMPPPAHVAQEWASRPQYRCRRCGRIDRDDDNDVCDSCGAPSSDLERELAFDPAPVRARYEECLRKGDDRDVLQENVVDVQVAKLLVAHNYVLFRRQQLKEQLEVMRNAQRLQH